MPKLALVRSNDVSNVMGETAAVSENDNDQNEERRLSGLRDRRSDSTFVDGVQSADKGLGILRNFVTVIVLLIGFGVSIGIQIANNRATSDAITKFNDRLDRISAQVAGIDTNRQLSAQDEKNRYDRLAERMARAESTISTIAEAYQYNLNGRVSVIEGHLRLPVRSLPPPQVQAPQSQP